MCDDLARAVDRLALIGAQDALILLRASFSAPRVLYLMRCSPSAENHGLQVFDDLLRSAVSKITNSDLLDIQWLQASMPIKFGGLGDKGYLACNSCFFGIGGEYPSPPKSHFGIRPMSFLHQYLEQYLSTWSSLADTYGIPDPCRENSPSETRQVSWQIMHALSHLSFSSHSSRARFLASQAPHSGAWLLALPVANCGMCLDDEAVRVAVSMRPGLSLCIPHECHCGRHHGWCNGVQVNTQGIMFLMTPLRQMWGCHYVSHMALCERTNQQRNTRRAYLSTLLLMTFTCMRIH